MTPFAAYLRTSTDDHQSPKDSAAWQLRLARQLIGPADGEIVFTYHDVDQSRSLPWERRPEAARLLDDLRDPARGWDDLVIAEPQRAFAGNQFGLVFPVLVHYGVRLWVPEVGGAVDPDSEAHDLLMSLFGGLAKAERNRIRHRVRAAMAAHALSGRWLGGRPPYGYTLIEEGPHPNPEKAASGVRLHQLEPDLETAPVVERIFDLYLNGGHGFKAIAALLTAEGIPCPSAHDPGRNPHRSGHAWAGSAVRAILTNPRYLGRHVFGRQRRQERLLDPMQPALGHATRLSWRPEDEWVIAEEVSHPPLVDEETWRQAQVRMGERARGKGITPTPRSTAGRYALVGLISCQHCGRRMQGNHSRGLAYYRCKIAAAPDGHPRTLAVREDRILPVLDEWLVGMFAPDRIEEVAQQVVDAELLDHDDDRIARDARGTIAEGRAKLDRYVAALEAGMDPKLVAERTRAAQAEIEKAQRILDGSRRPEPSLSVDQVVEVLQSLWELPALLSEADTALRADVYRSLGLQLAYRREDDREFVSVDASLTGRGPDGVGGGI